MSVKEFYSYGFLNQNNHKYTNQSSVIHLKIARECSGSVIECLNRDREAAGSSLTGITALWSLSKTHLS